MFSLVESCPLLCDLPHSECAYLADSQAKLNFAYEAQRDFLSAPRCFVLLELTLFGAIYTGGEGLNDDQWQALQSLPWGIYSMALDEPKEESGALHYVFYNANYIFDYIAVMRPESLQKRYHFSSAREALVQSLFK